MTSVRRAAPDPAPVDESSGADGQAGAPAPALFDHYLEPGRPHPGAYDEMFHPDGTSARPTARCTRRSHPRPPPT